jgi:hypothetical protein
MNRLKSESPTSTRRPPTAEEMLLHDDACARGDIGYTDPATGYLVFTAEYHRARGHCCDSGCRHCPYREAEDANRG